MKFNCRFASLHEAVRRITPIRITVRIHLQTHYRSPEYGTALELLNKGLKVTLDEISIAENGLLNYRGRQVSLYIADHGADARRVMAGLKEGHRFHVADCETLKSMREAGRYPRYVATTNFTGLFNITGHEEASSRRGVIGTARLMPCKNCLRMLNYQNAARSKADLITAVEKFDMSEFFDTCSSYLLAAPKAETVNKAMGAYDPDWERISRRRREKAGWICDECGVNLCQDRRLLHTHHKDGRKDHNDENNLRPLCILCHRRQPKHEYLDEKITREDILQVYRRRLEQHIIADKWHDVFAFVDPKMLPALQAIRAKERNGVKGVHSPQSPAMVGGRIVDCAWVSTGWKKALAVDWKGPSVFDGWEIRSASSVANYYRQK